MAYAADEAAVLDYDYAANPNTGYVEGGSPVTSAPATGYNTTPTEATQEAAAAAAPPPPATINASASGETAAQIAADLASLPSLDTLGNDVETGDTTASNIENTLAPNGIPAYVAAQTTPTGPSAALTNAMNQAIAVLQGYGLTGDIGAGLTAMLQNGLDATTIYNILDSSNPQATIQGLGLSSTQLAAATSLVSSWQARFVGNQARIAAGLNPLDPATYIANEQSYKQVMSMAGIPASSPLQSTAYLGQLMGQDVSPAEVSQRVNAATSAVQNEDPAVIAQLQSQFGLSQSTIISHLLDPAVSAPVVQQEYNAATIAAEAARAGVAITVGNTGGNTQSGGLTNQNALQMQLAAQGVTQAQAAQSFNTIAQQQPELQAIAQRYGAGYTGPANIGSALTATQFNLTGAAAAQAQLNRLTTAETSAFSGSAGAATGSLGLRDTSGLQ